VDPSPPIFARIDLMGRHRLRVNQSTDTIRPTSAISLSCASCPELGGRQTLRRSFGELRGLPYYCSTAGKHSYRWVKANEVRNVTSDRRDH
jgi:hypothetical protein